MTLHQQVHELFLLEKHLRGLLARQDAANRRLKAQSVKLEQYLQQHRELAEQVKAAKAAAGGLETEIKGLEAKINKGREEMGKVRSDKEYRALLLEINTFKDDKGKLEDQALQHLTKVDEKNKVMEGVQAQVDAQRKIVALAQSELDAAKAEGGTQVERLRADRDAAASRLPEPALRMFTEAATLNDGDTLAAIVEESRKHLEYSCGGCFMSIPVESVNIVMGKPNEITTCVNCGRILFMEAELKEALSR